MEENQNYLIGSLGVATLLSLSAYGSCNGMSICGASAALHSSSPIVITYSYVSMIIISTVFFYAFILSIIIINKFDSTYSFIAAIKHLACGIVFGSIGLSGGLSMGQVSKKGFAKLAKYPSFFMPFLISLASIEVTLVIAFLCALLIIFTSK